MNPGRLTRILMLAGLFMTATTNASADTVLDFMHIGGSGADVSSQLKVTVSYNNVTSKVSFLIENTTPGAASAIKGVYFEDTGGLLNQGSYTIINGPGVNFVFGGAPAALPSANSANPNFVTAFAFNAQAPPPKAGIGLGESLIIELALNGTFANLEKALLGLSDDRIRIGMHVIAIAPDGESAQFVSTTPPPPPVAPVPAAVWGGFVLMGLIGAARIRNERE